MTIAESLANVEHPERPCRFAAILAGLDNTDRDAVLATLRTRTKSDPKLAKVLTDAGHPISAATIQRHRVALCHCTTTESETA